MSNVEQEISNYEVFLLRHSAVKNIAITHSHAPAWEPV